MLPIDDVLPQIVTTLADSPGCVLQAPPGAGKTTRVPLALLDAPWLGNRKIVMLEPRRLAARAAASYMSRLRGEAVGETVGYRIRFDTKVSSRTRIEVVTEGVLTRMLQSDQALEEYGVVIFDEFHERSLHADLGLALTLQSRALLRPDLRLLIMSATIETQAVAELLGNAPIITSSGKSFPVETKYLGRNTSVAHAVKTALYETAGDVLTFLPGQAEIHRTLDALVNDVDRDTYVVPLYGNLTQAEQDRAIAPSAAGQRKVVLATAIAETSLTIEGVRAVVDSGLMRVPRFDARTGMTRLATVNVTRASADQRRGRAGRVAPGVCYRLWSEHDDAGLVPHTRPEILEADLAPLALDLAAWGVTDPNELSWLDAPPESSYSQALELLRELNAINDDGSITAHGARMAKLPVHPRLAHMLLRAKEIGEGPLACALAALLSDRLRTDRIDRNALAQVKREAEHYQKLLHVHGDAGSLERAGLLLAFAYPDRIGQNRGGRGRFLLRNGRGASLDVAHPSAGEEFIVAAELEGSGRDSRIFLAASLSEADLREYFGEQVDSHRSIEVSPNGKPFVIVREQLGAIVLSESQNFDLIAEEAAGVLISQVRQMGISALPWPKLRERLVFMHEVDAAWPDVSDEALLGSIEAWFPPDTRNLKSLDLESVLLSLLTWQQRAALDKLAPTHLVVPTGSHISIDYSDPSAPFAAVRLQEVFGMQSTPMLGGGKVPLTLRLLSPAQRPVQVTRDLASFWKQGYFDVKKELKGRYPKHYWPDDPLVAEPTRGVKRKS